ncbi:MAG: hypothetical protein ACW99G_21765, partial [Candidatus Thorarchaeota archaeon]
MEYDPTEMYRVDPGEEELSEEVQAEFALEQQAQDVQAVQAAQLEAGATTPTGEQPTTAQQPVPSTEVQQKEQQFPWEEGYDLGDYARQTAEGAFAAPTGMLDFGVDVINKVTGQKFAKLPEFETDHFQALREISSVILPTIGLTRLGMRGGVAAHGRVGWGIGNNAFIKTVSTLGVESAAGVAVGAVSSEYEEDNVTGALKQAWPKTWDFIPDWLATLKDDGADMKRKKNMYEDLGMGPITSLATGFVKLGASMTNALASLRKSNKLVGETPQARKWLQGNQPKPLSDDPGEAVTQAVAKQEDALDEIGYFNMSENPNADVALKGVHDLFDYGELGVRTVDDFGVVGAAIDQARIARNLDTVDGRIGNMISEPALKYALKSGDNAQDIVLGLADQLRQAGRVGMEGPNWKVTFDDVLDANEDLAIDLFDPRMSKTEVRQVLEPFITRDANGKEIMAEGGFAMAAKALRG